METCVAFLRNCWYVAAWDHEVGKSDLFRRTLLNEPLMLFRDTDGVAHALLDRCPHRFAPLSKGRHKGDCVQCPYHGLEFDATGACVHNPHGNGAIPKAAAVRAYPTVERHSTIWVWMGDPDRADPARIPDFSCMDPARNFVGKRYLHARANYVLETDNILDLSHIEFLHPGTLGSAGVKQAVARVEQVGEQVTIYRQTANEVMTDFLYDAMGIARGIPVDRWFDVRWNAPACMLLDAGATPAGQPRPHDTGAPMFPHLFSPESESTTHYWYAVALPRSVGEQGAQVVEHIVDGARQPFEEEDLPLLEAQQEAIGDSDFWSLKPVLLAGDAGAVRARRVLDKLIAQEQA
jgi:vanillate O-demethylase monooxygenase subunit